MDFITELKKLCVELQKEDVIVYHEQAKAMNDKDAELQELIGKFNLAQYNLRAESLNPNGDAEKMNELDLEVNKLYEEIMENENMIAYNEARAELDKFYKYVQAVLTTTMNGGDPMSVQEPADDCTGNCSSCSGCH